MYIYACSYKHPDGRISYYVGKHEEPYEQSRWYLGSGTFCKNFKKKYGKEYTKKNVIKKILLHSLPDRKTLCQWEKIFIASYRFIYGNLCKNQAKGGEGGSGTHTEEHKRKISEAVRDRTVYTFRNVCTNEVFTGNQRTFIEKYNLANGRVSLLIHGKRNHHRYWVMNNSKIKSRKDLKRVGNQDMTIYTFRNLNTNQTFTGTRYDFYTNYGLVKVSVGRLIHGKRKSHKGWILIADNKDK